MVAVQAATPVKVCPPPFVYSKGVVAPSDSAVPLHTSRAVVPLFGSSGLAKPVPRARP